MERVWIRAVAWSRDTSWLIYSIKWQHKELRVLHEKLCVYSRFWILTSLELASFFFTAARLRWRKVYAEPPCLVGGSAFPQRMLLWFFNLQRQDSHCKGLLQIVAVAKYNKLVRRFGAYPKLKSHWYWEGMFDRFVYSKDNVFPDEWPAF